MNTEIYKLSQYGEHLVGTIEDNTIYATQGHSSNVHGYITDKNRIIRKTAKSEQELGYFTEEGQIISNGLFEGGAIGWVDDDGTVIQAGLIFGEEEVGRVSGSNQLAAAAALLLHFLPLDAEEGRRMGR